MPIIDIQLVFESKDKAEGNLAQNLSNALGKVLNAEPGRVWVRLLLLNSDCYAENEVTVKPSELPVFVKVLHATLPEAKILAEQSELLATTVALCLGRQPERVHIEYAAAGAGRMAFGGKLVQI